MSTSDFINSTDEQGTGDGLGLSPDSHYNGSVSTACNGHGSDITAEQYTTAQHSVFKSVQVEADDNFEFSASATVGSVEELARKVHSALQMEEEFEEMFEYPEGYLKIRQDPKSAAAAATEIAENGYSKLDHIDRQNASQKADGSTPIQLHVPQSNGITTKKDSRKELLKTGDKYRLLYSIDISDSSEEDIDEDWFHEMPEADSTSFPCGHITSRNGTGSTAEQGLVNVTDDPLLSYSDFEDEYFAGNSTNGKPSPSPPKSVKPEPSNEHSRADYDHSFTPLHAIGVAQLKQLLMSLQKRVQGTYHYIDMHTLLKPFQNSVCIVYIYISYIPVSQWTMCFLYTDCMHIPTTKQQSHK